MCGILGILNSENAAKNLALGLKKIENRGKDGFGIATQDELFFSKDFDEIKNKLLSNTFSQPKNVFGHVLHSIVDLILQPLKFVQNGKCNCAPEHNCNCGNNCHCVSIFIANCEIYNWRELAKKYNIDAKNDAELLFMLLEKKGIRILEEVDGDYAFAYWHDNLVYLARDVFGVKPVWFSHNDSFAFSSEKKALLEIGYLNPIELNPRQILVYNIANNSISYLHRFFFGIAPKIDDIPEKIEEKVFGLLTNAVAKRIPEKKLGLLFSGGVDSTFIALILKNLGVDFTCYVAAVEDDETKSEDVDFALMAAKALDLDLKIVKIKFDEVENYLKIIAPLIEDTNVVKVGVALPFFLASEAAKIDGIKVLMSGLGSEELFAGYQRHTKSVGVDALNKECLSGLIKIYERDLYRDDVVTMFNNIELRVPFLDKALAEYSLKIPEELKIKDEIGKYVLRKAAERYGMPKEFAWRKKRAAQYGSRFDKAIERLAKKEKKSKSEYLSQFYEPANLKLGVLFSGGKDSVYAMHIMKNQNYEITCLISIASENKDSFMFHTPNINLTELQAQALEIPIIVHKTAGEKEKELSDLKDAIKLAVEKYKIQGIVTGALYSNYQRERIEKICDELGLKIFSPLWHMNQVEEMSQIIDKFEIVFSSVAAEGLDKTWLARPILETDLDKLILLEKKVGLNVAGEGGEFESLVLDAPMFTKKLQIEEFEIMVDPKSENAAKMVVKKANLVEK